MKILNRSNAFSKILSGNLFTKSALLFKHRVNLTLSTILQYKVKVVIILVVVVKPENARRNQNATADYCGCGDNHCFVGGLATAAKLILISVDSLLCGVGFFSPWVVQLYSRTVIHYFYDMA